MNKIRIFIEYITAILFFVLSAHLAGKALTEILGETHEDIFHAEEIVSLIEMLHVHEILWGGIPALLFVYLWNKTFLSRFIPCRHEHEKHMTHEGILFHFLAIIFFLTHLFPEAAVRVELLENVTHNAFSYTVFFAFAIHFILDVVIAYGLIRSIHSRVYAIIAGLFILIVWIYANTNPFTNVHIPLLENYSEMWYLLGSFFIAMFIHIHISKNNRPL
ncbi:MAG: hypothetical protein QM526_00945 [Alphaproteobacteria bacterium]|nr:hypothetical protein [Alphaproteobacteria bacterium]